MKPYEKLFRYIYSLALAAASLVCRIAEAQTKEEWDKCAAIVDNGPRLYCYDKLTSVPTAAAPTAKASGALGKWQVATSRSAVEGTAILLVAENPIVERSGLNPIPTLYVRCRDKKMEAYIRFETYLGPDSLDVTTKVDKEPSRVSNWSISTDHRSAFKPQASSFIKTLIGKENLFVKLTPHHQEPVATYFDIRGLSEAIKPLKESCAWK